MRGKVESLFHSWLAFSLESRVERHFFGISKYFADFGGLVMEMQWVECGCGGGFWTGDDTDYEGDDTDYEQDEWDDNEDDEDYVDDPDVIDVGEYVPF